MNGWYYIVFVVNPVTITAAFVLRLSLMNRRARRANPEVPFYRCQECHEIVWKGAAACGTCERKYAESYADWDEAMPVVPALQATEGDGLASGQHREPSGDRRAGLLTPALSAQR